MSDPIPFRKRPEQMQATAANEPAPVEENMSAVVGKPSFMSFGYPPEAARMLKGTLTAPKKTSSSLKD